MPLAPANIRVKGLGGYGAEGCRHGGHQPDLTVKGGKDIGVAIQEFTIAVGDDAIGYARSG